MKHNHGYHSEHGVSYLKVAVLGAADWPSTFIVKIIASSELFLYDVAPVTPGVAVDLSHIPHR